MPGYVATGCGPCTVSKLLFVPPTTPRPAGTTYLEGKRAKSYSAFNQIRCLKVTILLIFFSINVTLLYQFLREMQYLSYNLCQNIIRPQPPEPRSYAGGEQSVRGLPEQVTSVHLYYVLRRSQHRMRRNVNHVSIRQ